MPEGTVVRVGRRDVPQFGPTTLVDRVADASPHNAISFGEQRITYGDLPARAAATAAWLAELGVRAGDHVAVWMPNRIEWVEVWFGLSRLGAVIVPLNTRFSLAEVEYVLRQSGARWLLRVEGVGSLTGAAVSGLVAAGGISVEGGAVIGGEPSYPSEVPWPSAIPNCPNDSVSGGRRRRRRSCDDPEHVGLEGIPEGGVQPTPR